MGRVRRFVFVVGCALALAVPVHASVNLPLHHWAYEAIDRLVAMGVVDGVMVGTKPYGRKEAARAVARAVERIRANQLPEDGRERVAELLLVRLMEEFGQELKDLGTIKRKRDEQTSLIRYGARVQTEVDGFSVGNGQTVRFRENRGGEYYAHGVQNQTDIRGWLEVGDWLALQAQPKFITNTKTLANGPTTGPLTSFNNQSVYLREASAKLSYANIALEVGRGTQWWGQGYHGSLLLTDHAFPLDMIKLGSDEPFRLPWVLRHLGEWKIESFLAQLEGTQTFPHEKIFGLRVNYLPTAWLELGLTRLTQFDGQGSGGSFPRTVVDCYRKPPNQTGVANCNEQAMLDGRVRIPHVPYLVPFPGGIQIYGELGSEDKWSQYPLPSRGAYLAGLYIPQVFGGDTTDLRVEFADTDFTRRNIGLSGVWYNNSTYTNGMRQYGFPLGHSMGTDGIDFFVRSTRYVTPSVQVGSNFNLQERARGQQVHERKWEYAIDMSWWLSARAQVQAGYTYQYLKNPGQITSVVPFAESFAPGVTAENHFLWTSVTVEF